MESLMLNKYYDYICPVPDFLYKYLELDIFLRLKDVSYFCGMNFASKDIYDFKYNISRFDHSISTALLTYKFTEDKTQTLAALFHDISSPCFSHVIDYMNGDYIKQESTEGKTKDVILKSDLLCKYLNNDKVSPENIINFSNYPIVDNSRPKLCADRFDGVMLPAFSWSKELEIEDSKEYIDSLRVYKNEFNENELGFNSKSVALKFQSLSDNINNLTHSKEDLYMMLLLAKITKIAINRNIINYDALYILNENELFDIINRYVLLYPDLNNLLTKFYCIKKYQIHDNESLKVKNKIIDPLVQGKRLSLLR